MFALAPEVVFAARVNQSGFTYPLAQVTFDGVTTGAYTDVEPGMTVHFGTSAEAADLGRQRVRKAATSSLLYFGRSSRNSHEGEVTLADDAYITVYNWRQVWAKVPTIEDDGTIYKDHDLSPAGSVADQPPVANTGPGTAGTIDPATDKLRVKLPHTGSNNSFATATGESISTYAWGLPSGVSLVAGYALSDAVIEVDCDPGFYYVSLTVTDSAGETHTAYAPIYARDPDDDPTVQVAIRRHRRAPEGQQIAVDLLDEGMSAADYPDGTFVMLWADEPASSADRDHLIFSGWVYAEPTRLGRERTGLTRTTTLELRDVGGWLALRPAFYQAVSNSSFEGASSQEAWQLLDDPTLDQFIHYLLYWHSTALELADFSWSGTGSTYDFVTLGAWGTSLFEQVQSRAAAFCPDRAFTCDRLGRLSLKPVPLLQETADRTSTVQLAVGSDWETLDYRQQRAPGTRWHREQGVLADADAINAVFSVSGVAPSQGVREKTVTEQLTPSQAVLNQVCGQRYARMNAPQGPFTARLATAPNLETLDPAQMEWITLTVSAAEAAQRGLAFTADRFLLLAVDFNWTFSRAGVTCVPVIEIERETSGPPGVTEIITQDGISEYPNLPIDFPNITWDPIGDEPSGYETDLDFPDTPAMYLLSDVALARTRNPGDSPPAWEAMFYNTDVRDANFELLTFKLDPWNPKNAAYLGGGDASAEEGYLYYVENLNGPSGTQTFTLIHAVSYSLTAGAAVNMQIEASINVPGAVFVAYANGENQTKYYLDRRTGYGGSFNHVLLDTISVGRSTSTLPIWLGYHASGAASGDVYAATRLDILKSTDFGASYSLDYTADGFWWIGYVKGPYDDNLADEIVYFGKGQNETKHYRRNVGGGVDALSSATQIGGSTDLHQYITRCIDVNTFNRQKIARLNGNTPLSVSLQISDDGGDSWTGKTTLPSGPDRWNILGGWPWDIDRLFLSTADASGSIYTSDDRGDTWRDLKGDYDTAITGGYTVCHDLAVVWVP